MHGLHATRLQPSPKRQRTRKRQPSTNACRHISNSCRMAPTTHPSISHRKKGLPHGKTRHSLKTAALTKLKLTNKNRTSSPFISATEKTTHATEFSMPQHRSKIQTREGFHALPLTTSPHTPTPDLIIPKKSQSQEPSNACTRRYKSSQFHNSPSPPRGKLQSGDPSRL